MQRSLAHSVHDDNLLSSPLKSLEAAELNANDSVICDSTTISSHNSEAKLSEYEKNRNIAERKFTYFFSKWHDNFKNSNIITGKSIAEIKDYYQWNGSRNLLQPARLKRVTNSGAERKDCGIGKWIGNGAYQRYLIFSVMRCCHYNNPGRFGWRRDKRCSGRNEYISSQYSCPSNSRTAPSSSGFISISWK